VNAPSMQREIAAEAARLIVESGLDYGSAKSKAARALGQRRGELPSNELVEDAVREHLDLFCAQSQPGEVALLRRLALAWMRRLESLRPHLAGAVWRGTATRQSAIHIDLYGDDPKTASLALLNLGIRHAVDGEAGRHGADDTLVLTVMDRVPGWPEPVTVHLQVHDHDALRGALKPDSRGRSWRGDVGAVARLVEAGPA
jgi:hypothetical protein